MDTPIGSHSSKIEHWKLCCGKIPRAEIIFFAQLLICITLIIASIAMLALHDTNRDFWMVILSHGVHYAQSQPSQV